MLIAETFPTGRREIEFLSHSYSNKKALLYTSDNKEPHTEELHDGVGGTFKHPFHIP